MLVKPWNPELDIHTETLTSLPIWVQFHELELKYWGMDCLGKIGSILGIPIKTDRYTMERRLLKHARLLIEIPLDAPFPDFLEFINDQDVVVRVPVCFEWKPLKCAHCHMFGHLDSECRKKQKATHPQKEWRPVQQKESHGIPDPKQSDNEGFTMVTAGQRSSPRKGQLVSKEHGPQPVTTNKFAVLEQQPVFTKAPIGQKEGPWPHG